MTDKMYSIETDVDFILLCDQIDRNKKEDQLEWPHSGEKFTIYVAALPDMDYQIEDIVMVQPPEKVRNVCREIIGESVTDDIFVGSLPDSVGLWEMEIQFEAAYGSYGAYTDGHDDEFGFAVLSLKKL